MNNWLVITGGPCSGKTTTIEILKKLGKRVTNETARQYYESQIASGLTNEQIRSDPQKLQDSIAKLQIELEDSLNPQEELFLDRAKPDSMAYYDFLKIEVPQWVVAEHKKSNYKKVFILERLPMIKDSIRTESDEEAQAIENCIVKSYSSLPLDVVKVPVMAKDERVDFILKQVPHK